MLYCLKVSIYGTGLRSNTKHQSHLSHRHQTTFPIFLFYLSETIEYLQFFKNQKKIKLPFSFCNVKKEMSKMCLFPEMQITAICNFS